MDERDLTRLSFIASALVRSPSQFGRIAAHIRASGLSPELEKALKALEDVQQRMPKSAVQNAKDLSRTIESLRPIAKKMLRAADPSKKDVGRALAWAIEVSGSQAA